jgi:hypothetical protein
MKKIINGKCYNTETATNLCTYWNGLSGRDFRNLSEGLYRTKKGAYFLAGEGGPMSKYSRPCGDMTGGGEGLEPITKSEALEWMEKYGDTETIEKYFSDVIEQA